VPFLLQHHHQLLLLLILLQNLFPNYHYLLLLKDITDCEHAQVSNYQIKLTRCKAKIFGAQVYSLPHPPIIKSITYRLLLFMTHKKRQAIEEKGLYTIYLAFLVKSENRSLLSLFS